MKRIIVLTILFFALAIHSQNESALDSVSKKTCEYLNSKKFKELPKKEKTTSLGLFMLKMYDKHKNSLNKEGIKLEVAKGREGGRELGQKIGINMVKFCPEALIMLAEEDENETEGNLEADEIVFSVSGKLKSISGDEISIISLKDENGKTQKFIWLNNFEGSDRLITSNKIKNLKVKVSYKNLEIYSPKLKEYIVRKQITKIEYL